MTIEVFISYTHEGRAYQKELEKHLVNLSRLDHRHSYVNGIAYRAIFDVNGSYRYCLCHAWSAVHARIAFILLNPSTADEKIKDPTIRRCIGFARAWNFGSMEVVN